MKNFKVGDWVERKEGTLDGDWDKWFPVGQPFRVDSISIYGSLQKKNKSGRLSISPIWCRLAYTNFFKIFYGKL